MKIPIVSLIVSLMFTGLMAGASHADEFEEAHKRFAAKLDADLEQQLSDMLDAQLDELTAELERREAFAMRRLTPPDRDDRMNCVVSPDQVLECTVVAERPSKADRLADSPLPASAR